MNSYIRILPTLFVIANISCYSSEGSMNDSNIIKYQVNIEQYIDELRKDIEGAIADDIKQKVFNQYPERQKKLLKQFDDLCNTREMLFKRFQATKNIGYVNNLLLIYYHFICTITMDINNYITKLKNNKYTMQQHDNDYIMQQLESYCQSVEHCLEDTLYPLFNQKIMEYKININPSFDIFKIKFYYKEIKSLKGLISIILQTINDIKKQYSKTFGKVYIGGFRDITKHIIGLLNQFNAQLNSIDQNNYINTVTELHSILKQLNKANGNYNTRYSEKQRAIRNNTIKKGINKLIYNIDEVRQFGQLIYNCSTNLAKSFYSILNGGQIMSLALG